MSDIKTFCKDCKFSIRTEKKQVGCHMGVIEQIMEKKEYIIQENDTSFVIDKFFCPYIRPSNWLPEKDIEESKKQIIKDTELKITAVIMCRDSLEDMEYTLNAVLDQQLDFSDICFIILPKSNIKTSKIQKSMDTKETKITWNVRICVDKDMSDMECVDTAIPSINGTYASVFECGKVIEKDFTSNLNRLFREMGGKFLFVDYGEGNHKITFQSIAHHLYGGYNEVIFDDGVKTSDLKVKISKVCELEKVDTAIITLGN